MRILKRSPQILEPDEAENAFNVLKRQYERRNEKGLPEEKITDLLRKIFRKRKIKHQDRFKQRQETDVKTKESIDEGTAACEEAKKQANAKANENPISRANDGEDMDAAASDKSNADKILKQTKEGFFEDVPESELPDHDIEDHYEALKAIGPAESFTEASSDHDIDGWVHVSSANDENTEEESQSSEQEGDDYADENLFFEAADTSAEKEGPETKVKKCIQYVYKRFPWNQIYWAVERILMRFIAIHSTRASGARIDLILFYPYIKRFIWENLRKKLCHFPFAEQHGHWRQPQHEDQPGSHQHEAPPLWSQPQRVRGTGEEGDD